MYVSTIEFKTNAWTDGWTLSSMFFIKSHTQKDCTSTFPFYFKFRKKFADSQSGDQGEIDVFKQVLGLTTLCRHGDDKLGKGNEGDESGDSNGVSTSGRDDAVDSDSHFSAGAGENGAVGNTVVGAGADEQKRPTGLALFPNVDSQCFKGLKSHVEIDLVLLHPHKGIFLFNVKNQKKLKAPGIVDDIERHSSFLRNLCQGEQLRGEHWI